MYFVPTWFLLSQMPISMKGNPWPNALITFAILRVGVESKGLSHCTYIDRYLHTYSFGVPYHTKFLNACETEHLLPYTAVLSGLWS